MKPKHERRKLKNYLFVNKAQTAIFVSSLVLLMFVIAIIIFAVISPFYSDMIKSDDIYLQNLSAKILIVMLERCAVAFTIILIPVLIQQVFVIHRICGPFISFKKTLDSVSAGNLSRKIHLRRYDFFHPEARQINKILEDWSSACSEISVHQDLILKKMDQLSPENQTGPQLAELLAEIKSRTQSTIRELSKIKGRAAD